MSLAAKTSKPGVRKSAGLSADEKAAMRERVNELKAAAAGADGERAVLAKIAEMPAADRAMATRIHALVKAEAPTLTPRTWYGMPAYSRGDDVVFFFQSGAKFKARYCTFGFTDKAKLDDGRLWPAAYALTQLTAAEEAKLAALVRKAVG